MKMNKLVIAMLITPTMAFSEVVTVPVTSVEPVYTSVRVKGVPTRTCTEREVTVNRDRSDNINVTGAAVGALVGHVIGRAASGNDGTRILSTIAGGAIGNKIGQNSDNKSNTRIMNDCVVHENYTTQNVISSYKVKYKLDGYERLVRFSYDPGSTIKVDVKKVYTVLK